MAINSEVKPLSSPNVFLVGMACFLTAITTSIGFASLSLAQHAIVREFGWSCVLGVALTVVAILLVIPLAYFSKTAKFSRRVLSRKIFGVRLEPVEQQEGLIERHLHRGRDRLLGRPGAGG